MLYQKHIFNLLSLFFSSVGGLVRKILETKKDYESSPSTPKSKEQVWKLK